MQSLPFGLRKSMRSCKEKAIVNVGVKCNAEARQEDRKELFRFKASLVHIASGQSGLQNKDKVPVRVSERTPKKEDTLLL